MQGGLCNVSVGDDLFVCWRLVWVGLVPSLFVSGLVWEHVVRSRYDCVTGTIFCVSFVDDFNACSLCVGF